MQLVQLQDELGIMQGRRVTSLVKAMLTQPTPWGAGC